MLVNAFSLNMLASFNANIIVRPATAADAVAAFRCGGSGIGHADTANLLTGILGVKVPTNRVTVSLSKGDRIIVAQYSGPRLSEGVTVLPEGSKIEFISVEVR